MANKFLEEIIENNDSNRMVSPFQCLSLKDKIQQYALTSSNIIFGNMLEQAVKEIMESHGACYFSRSIENYDFDQLCMIDNYIIMIEQKIRDDHDSTKKVGQIQNYLKKKKLVKKSYPNYQLISMMWFIDPFFTKNYNYYSQIIAEELVYGEEMFKYLQDIVDINFSTSWEEFLKKVNDIKILIRSNCYINEITKDPIDITKISLSKLFDYMNIGNPSEIIQIFFAGQDFSQKILDACDKSRQIKKVKALKELVNNGYFK